MHNFSLFPLFLLEAAKNDKKDNKVETFSSELRWLGRWPTLKPEQDVEMFFLQFWSQWESRENQGPGTIRAFSLIF